VMKNLGIESIILLEIIELFLHILRKHGTNFRDSAEGSDDEWEKYKIMFQNRYPNPQMNSLRKKLWLSKTNAIKAHNSKANNGDHSYIMSENIFSDYTEEENEK
ncbi:hypothetical protein QYM36_008303, partial [Artemia franciscana]